MEYKKFSILAKRAIPAFIREDYPEYVSLLTSYFRFLERDMDVNNSTVLELFAGDAVPGDNWAGIYIRTSVTDYTTLLNFKDRIIFSDNSTGNVVDVVDIAGQWVLKVQDVSGPAFAVNDEIHYADTGEYTKIANMFLTMDVDKSSDEFLSLHEKDFINDFPRNLTTDLPLLLKRIRTLYTTKGSKASFDMLFALLYDTEVDIEYPKLDILRCSDGEWIQPFNIKMESSNIYTDVLIKGVASNATGYISNFRYVEHNDEGVEGNFEWVGYLTDVIGVFENGETIINSVTEETLDVVKSVLPLEGTWDGERGHLSGTNKLQDDDKYQDFSYVLKTDITSDLYSDTIDRLVHPAGFIRFEELVFPSENPLAFGHVTIAELLWIIINQVHHLEAGSDISFVGGRIAQLVSDGNNLRTYSYVELNRETDLNISSLWHRMDYFDNIDIDDFDLYANEPFNHRP